MAQQHGAPSLPTLPDNTLQDIVTSLDGHDLLSLLAICRDLHGSAALKACLIEAVMQQLAALQAASQIMVHALEEAQSVQQRALSLLHALTAVAVQMAAEGNAAAFDLVGWKVCQDTYNELLSAIGGDRLGLNLAAMRKLEQAKTALQQALALGQPGQQAPAVGQPAHPEQQAEGQTDQPQAAGQQPHGPMVAQARREAVEALQLVGPGQPARQVEALQAAVRAVLAGQRQGGIALKAVLQAQAQQLKQRARETMGRFLQQGLQVLDGVSDDDGDDNDDDHVQALQAAVQGGQAALQEHAG